MMYYYNISEGEYSDYDYCILGHEKEFTKRELAELFNSIAKELGNCLGARGKIIDQLTEKHGFIEIEETWEIRMDGFTNKPQYIDEKEIKDEATVMVSYNYVFFK